MIFSKGNAKIGKDTIITNMSPAMKCPSDKLGLCKMSKKCYAKKAEIQYHHVVPQHREKQMICWKTESEEKIFNDIRSKVKNARTNKIDYVRFNESGDFEDQEMLEKLKGICKLLSVDDVTKNIVVYGYTNRRDLDFKNLPKNLVINGTNFMVSNEFIPVPLKEITRYTNYCPGGAHKYTGGCRGCKKCKEANGSRIFVAIH